MLPFDEAVGETLGRARAARPADGPQHAAACCSRSPRCTASPIPAGGSWYVESLTDQLARAAWTQLQELERDGGIVAALSSGAVAERLAADTERRHDELARRQRILTGVNTFPLIGDDGLRAPERAAPRRAPTGASRRRGLARARARRGRRSSTSAPGPSTLAERGGAEPTILLACMGPLAAHVSINLWAKSFFESGGITTISSGAQPDDARPRRAAARARPERRRRLPGHATPSRRTRRGWSRRCARPARARCTSPAREQAAAEAAGADAGVRDGVDMVAVLGELLDRFEPRRRHR